MCLARKLYVKLPIEVTKENFLRLRELGPKVIAQQADALEGTVRQLFVALLCPQLWHRWLALTRETKIS